MNIKDKILNDIETRIDNQINKGVEKYGHSLDDCPHDKYDWLVMLNEELVDGLQYANKEIKRLKTMIDVLKATNADYAKRFSIDDTEVGMNKLTQLIQQWAIDKNLHVSNPRDQTLKLYEETGEVAAALSRGDEYEVKDGIGDSFVVLTILAMQIGVDIETCVKQAYDEIKDRKGKTINGIFVKEEDLK